MRTWADISALQGIGVLPDGTYINTTGDADADVLYEIIRAEAAGEISEDEASWQKAELARQIAANEYPDNREEQEKLYRDRLTVFLNRDISYYSIPDYTDWFDQVLRNETERVISLSGRISEKDNSGLTKYILITDLFTTGGRYDVKNWPQFQAHSMFIYNGEIVSRDAFANILYGYTLEALGVSGIDRTLGAGAQQAMDHTERIWAPYGWDDPRDEVRVIQGVMLYRQSQNPYM